MHNMYNPIKYTLLYTSYSTLMSCSKYILGASIGQKYDKILKRYQNCYCFKCKNGECSWVWWHLPLMSASGKTEQVGLCESEANLLYTASSKPSRATQRHLSNNSNGIEHR